MNIRLLLLGLHLSYTVSQIPQADKTCRAGEVCVTKAKCPIVEEKTTKLQSIKEKSYSTYLSLLKELQNLICNYEKEAFCCPSTPKDDSFAARTEINTKLLQTGFSSDPDSPSYIPAPGQCGVNPESGSQFIVGGENTAAGEFTFSALVGYTKKIARRVRGRRIEIDQDVFFCGGVLINKFYVLTAAHCQNLREKSISKVRLGEWWVGQSKGLPPVQDFIISKEDVVIHENYEDKNVLSVVINDIAIIKLPRPAQLNSGVNIACLPLDLPYNALKGERGTVIGWGYTSAFSFGLVDGDNKTKIPTTRQQKLELPFTSDCPVKKLHQSQLCAGGEKEKDSCRGDSGGGLFYKDGPQWYLVGLVSFGTKYCGVGRAGVYTRVTNFLPWIQKQIV